MGSGPPVRDSRRVPTSTTQPPGLSDADVLSHRERDGANVLPAPERTPVWRLLLAQMTHFFAGMLWVAAGLALLAGMVSLGMMMPGRTRVRRHDDTIEIDVCELVVDDAAHKQLLHARQGR